MFRGLMIVLLLPMSAWAQIKGDLKIADSIEMQVIELSDGSTLYGRIVDIRDDAIVFESIIGQFTINRASVQSVKTIQKSSLRKGKVWFENPHATRLYLASHSASGRVMKIPEEGDSFGSLYGVGTYGSRDDNVSLGVNVGFGNGDVSGDPVVMLGISTTHRPSNVVRFGKLVRTPEWRGCPVPRYPIFQRNPGRRRGVRAAVQSGMGGISVYSVRGFCRDVLSDPSVQE